MLDSTPVREISMRHHLVLIVLALFMAACGQKGPLYLPKDADKPAEQNLRKNEEGMIQR